MTGRDRINAALAHEPVDRIPIHDAPWGTTVARWHREGLPAETSADDFFGYEIGETWAGVGLRSDPMRVHSMQFQAIFLPSVHLIRRWTPRATNSSFPWTAGLSWTTG